MIAYWITSTPRQVYVCTRKHERSSACGQKDAREHANKRTRACICASTHIQTHADALGLHIRTWACMCTCTQIVLRSHLRTNASQARKRTAKTDSRDAARPVVADIKELLRRNVNAIVSEREAVTFTGKQRQVLRTTTYLDVLPVTRSHNGVACFGFDPTHFHIEILHRPRLMAVGAAAAPWRWTAPGMQHQTTILNNCLF